MKLEVPVCKLQHQRAKGLCRDHNSGLPASRTYTEPGNVVDKAVISRKPNLPRQILHGGACHQLGVSFSVELIRGAFEAHPRWHLYLPAADPLRRQLPFLAHTEKEEVVLAIQCFEGSTLRGRMLGGIIPKLSPGTPTGPTAGRLRSKTAQISL